MAQSGKLVNVSKSAGVYLTKPTEGHGHLFSVLGQVVNAMICDHILQAVQGIRASGAYVFLYDSPEGDEEVTCRRLEEMLQQRLEG